MKKSTVIRIVACLLVVPALGACAVHERTYSEPAAPPPPPPPAAVAAPPAPHPVAPVAAGVHPAYLHALSDLRNARANLERKGGDRQMKWDEHDAIVEIDHAIDDIKRASVDDGKNLDDHPAIDAREPRAGRLHKALAALHAAREDIAKEEDNGFASGLRARALHDVDEAIRHSDEGVRAADQQI